MALVVPVSVLQQVGALRFPLQDSLDWLFVGSVCSALLWVVTVLLQGLAKAGFCQVFGRVLPSLLVIGAVLKSPGPGNLCCSVTQEQQPWPSWRGRGDLGDEQHQFGWGEQHWRAKAALAAQCRTSA